jgi:hypothetical protein
MILVLGIFVSFGKKEFVMETIPLKNPDVLPTDEVIKAHLEITFPVYSEFLMRLKSEIPDVDCQWNFYNDGKAWLMKVVWKKKTIFWLSVWEGYFKIGFYFTEKNCTGLFDLGIDEVILRDFSQAKPIGKLLPLGIEMRRIEQIDDLMKIVGYKRSLK